ncbi:MAG: hypothetical protein JWL81_757, partial [Verrucomicrobiales bacterium]|nr:hypothetical protein [Verrucomicrobiales bacterium]
MKPRFLHPVGAALLILAGFLPHSAKAAIAFVDVADGEIVTDPAGVPFGTGAVGNQLNLPGAYYSGSPLHYIAPFQLPNLGPGVFSDVSFTVTSNSIFVTPTFNVDIYGITGVRATPDIVPADAIAGGTAGSLIQDNFWTADAVPTPGSYTTSPASGVVFAAWLNAQYADGLGANQYAFLRLSPDVINPPRSGFFLASANNAAPDARPF